MPQIPDGGLRGNGSTDDHLWKHGLDYRDAVVVWVGPAKYFEQQEAEESGDAGRLRVRPERTIMIGPDASGRLLTFILELPDHHEESHVVTGWPSTIGEQSRYHQPGGRMRRT